MARFLFSVLLVFGLLTGLAALASGGVISPSSPLAGAIIGSGGAPPPPCSPAPESADLLAPIPHGDGQTLLREALLVADHNSYHLGQLVLIRRMLGDWERAGE